MAKHPEQTPAAERFGGPGSSHQDREHPGKDHQPHGHKKGGGHPANAPGADHSKIVEDGEATHSG